MQRIAGRGLNFELATLSYGHVWTSGLIKSNY